MASWEESLKIGEIFERFIRIDIWRKSELKAEKNEVAANLKLYDMTLENGKTIECKYDEKAAETQNICIETHCNGSESGVLTTTADYWIISDRNKTFLIKTSELKRCIHEGHTSLFPHKPTKFLHMKKYPVKQEDGGVKLMNFYTIPTRIFEEYCDEVKEINNMTYKTLL
jgi:hypothetical protein